ncbi:hypothetical protein ACOSP7_032868 [Xanthoceras sorbifolium]
MDSQWINQQTTDGRNNYDQQHNNGGHENLDLTLRLGQPNNDDEDRHQANMASQRLVDDDNVATNPLYAQHIAPNLQGLGGHFSGSSVAAPATNPSQPHFNHPILPPIPPLPAMHNYTLIDVPDRRAERRQLEIGSSSSSASGGSGKRPRERTFIDPYKRCTNYNCNTNDTPMWRRGPLGHKTLCNACGIKYRKEEDKRKGREATNNGSSG